MDEFYAFLIAGLFIILALALLFGGEEIAIETNVSVENESGYVIYTGENATMGWRVVRINDFNEFTVGPRSYSLIPQTDVKNGLLFGNKVESLSFSIDQELVNKIDKASLTFKVADTNNYGNLVIKINGQVVYDDRPVKSLDEVVVTIEPSYLEEKNVIEISSSSSGWQIWAPTVYVLTDVTLKTELGRDQFPTFRFSLGDNEIEKFDSGRVVFRVEEATGNVSIDLNDVNIFNKMPRVHYVYSVGFDETIARIGKNYLQFKTLNGFAILSDAEVRIYYKK